MEKIPIKLMLEDMMYEIELRTVRESTANFVRDLNDHFRLYLELTPRQERVLWNIYDEHMGG